MRTAARPACRSSRSPSRTCRPAPTPCRPAPEPGAAVVSTFAAGGAGAFAAGDAAFSRRPIGRARRERGAAPARSRRGETERSYRVCYRDEAGSTTVQQSWPCAALAVERRSPRPAVRMRAQRAAELRHHLRRRPGLRRHRLLRRPQGRRGRARRTSTAWPPKASRFTDFYVAQAVCSASRAALLTGCYSEPRRHPRRARTAAQRHGINAERDDASPRCCKTRGYATAIFGKWHLGHQPQFLPTQHGFDEYFGLPYSNDMWPHHPTQQGFSRPAADRRRRRSSRLDPGPDAADDVVHRAGGRSSSSENKDKPFFLYVAARDAARAAVRVGQVQGQDRAGACTAT